MKTEDIFPRSDFEDSAALNPYRRLFELSYDLLCVIGYDGFMKEFNASFIDKFGFTEEELRSRPFLDFIHPDDRFTIGAEFNRAARGENIPGVELRGLCKDGGYRWISWVSYSSPHERLIYCSGQDITERKKDQSEFQAFRDRFQLLVECVVDYAIFMIDPKGYILTWNTGAERIKGYKEEEIIGKNFSIFYTKEDQAAGRPLALLETARERGRVEDSQWRVRKDGTKFWADVVISPVLDADGALLGFAKVTRDMTEQRKIDQMKSELISFTSHQLKTPLAQIYSYMDNMLAGIPGSMNEKQRHYLATVKEIAAENLQLVGDLLNVSKIEAGMLKTEIRPVPLEKIAGAVMDDFRQRAEEKNLELSFHPECGAATVLADMQKAEEALKNVLDNAIKYTDKGSITVKLLCDEKWGIIEVTDTGAGIPAEKLNQIFTKELVLNYHGSSKGGSGLGLYIAKNFMRLQNGDIAAVSPVGEGSTFILTLPLAEKN